MELVIQTSGYRSPADSEVEIVERKGLGHPDTICDAIAEEICRALCRGYLQTFGVILHHNVDKILLRGGAARPCFGGGEVLEPIEFYLGGRVTEELDGRRIPVVDIAVDACRGWLKTHLPELDLNRHVRIFPKFRPGSGELRSLFSKGKVVAFANDSSCGVGFVPFTALERVVLEVERTLNSADTKRLYSPIGQDIKVMGVRHGSQIHLTISCAMIGRHLSGAADYVRAKAAALELAVAAARQVTDFEIDGLVNAADDLERGEMFLTVTGTSAEAGDDGQVGRGNRVSGLITPYRPMTMEAAAGKNPVTHVGKLYNLAAGRIAQRIVASDSMFGGASCVLVSQIGRPVEDPEIVDVRLRVESAGERQTATEKAERIVREELQRFQELQMELLAGDTAVY